MAATIVRQRLLRTGPVNASASTATSTDEYLIVVSERCSKEKAWELFTAYTPNPIPKVTLKPFAGGWLICDAISASVANDKTSQIFKISVNWKEIESSQPNPLSSPMPNGDSVDPVDWAPTWSKRSNVIFEERDTVKLFYKGGYTGSVHGDLSASPSERKLFQASNRKPFSNPPATRTVVNTWNFRWLRLAVPSTLVLAEQKLNSTAFTVLIGGYSFVWQPATALIDSVELSRYKWGTQNLIEISVDLIHNKNGWYMEYLDKGIYVKNQYTGGNWNYKRASDAEGRPFAQPVKLDGNGYALADQDNGTPVYGKWSDHEEVAFNTVDLIKDIGS